jgi:hypothetical protein
VENPVPSELWIAMWSKPIVGSGRGERDAECDECEGLQRDAQVDDRVPAGLEVSSVARHPVR